MELSHFEDYEIGLAYAQKVNKACFVRFLQVMPVRTVEKWKIIFGQTNPILPIFKEQVVLISLLA